MGKNFRNIKAWQYADNLVAVIYKNTKLFPKDEIYGLVSQMRRAAVSVAANIAEGANRGYRKEYLRFLYMSRGSIAEVEYLLHLSRRLSYLTESDFKETEAIMKEAAKTLTGLIEYIERDKECSGSSV